MEGVTKKSEVDRISALPDSLVQHILSFLPSTKESIRTSILSKRWKNEWARVPVLVFKSSGMSAENFLKFTEAVLITYDSFKIKKFYIEYDNGSKEDPLFSAKLRFASRRNVEELILNNFSAHMLLCPDFVFEHASLFKLHILGCVVMPYKVKLECLRELSLTYCKLPNQAIESLLSGSPLLQSLKMTFCFGYEFSTLCIFSNTLKRCVLEDHRNFEISCPNLEELTVRGIGLTGHNMSNHILENVLSGNLLLESLELIGWNVVDQLVIASKSLKRLVLKGMTVSAVDILCPNIKELKVEDVKKGAVNLKT